MIEPMLEAHGAAVRGAAPRQPQHPRPQRRAAPAPATGPAAAVALLERTPYPMVLARLKVLMERLRALGASGGAAAASPHGRPPSAPAPAAAPRAAGGAAGGRRGGGLPDPSTGGVAGSIAGLSSPEKILDELEVTLSFVSPLLRRLPRASRRALCRAARVEAYKRDQAVFAAGDAADRFYAVLAKAVVASLRRGDAFGDSALLDGAARSTAAAPASASAALLALERADFLLILGPHFRAAQAAMLSFMGTQVRAVREARLAPGELPRLCAHVLTGSARGGKAWELAREPQIFFVREGACQLELVERSDWGQQPPWAGGTSGGGGGGQDPCSLPGFPAAPPPPRGPGSRPASAGGGGRASGAAQPAAAQGDGPGAAAAAGAGAGAAGGGAGAAARVMPPLATAGVLSTVRVAGAGRVVGTLGLEDELRKARLRGVTRKVIAHLGPGAAFGGGAALIGSGPVQSALRVVAGSEGVALYHIHADAFLAHAGDTLVRTLRDDLAFSLSYSLGRLGLLPPGAAVGHPSANLFRGQPPAAPPRPPPPPPPAAAGPRPRLRPCSPEGAGAAAASAAAGASGSSSGATTGPASPPRSRPASAGRRARGSGAAGIGCAVLLEPPPPPPLLSAEASAEGIVAPSCRPATAPAGGTAASSRAPGRPSSAPRRNGAGGGGSAAHGREQERDGAGGRLSQGALVALMQAEQLPCAGGGGRVATAREGCRWGPEAAAHGAAAETGAAPAPAAADGRPRPAAHTSPPPPPRRPSAVPAVVRLGTTAAGSFWLRPEHSASATGAAVASLILAAFPEGLAPLAEGIGSLRLSTQHWRYQPQPPAAQPGKAAARGRDSSGAEEEQGSATSVAAARPASAAAGARCSVARAPPVAAPRCRPASAAAAPRHRLSSGGVVPPAGQRGRGAGGRVVAYWGWPNAAAVVEGEEAPAFFATGTARPGLASKSSGGGGSSRGERAAGVQNRCSRAGGTGVGPGPAAEAAEAEWAAAGVADVSGESSSEDPTGDSGCAGGDDAPTSAAVTALQRLLLRSRCGAGGADAAATAAGPPRPTRPGALTAACVQWAAASDAAFRPPMRQCLTHEEMLQLRAARRGEWRQMHLRLTQRPHSAC
ncbi:hypothetical protein Rsub_11915 [Raphidocelis subcapitata]|uniref:Cyclic nucleotide-binding domain-containing protein n=1 Tax=Raphidocelis subcapitata TaxID=307507 RepID=A0A2V0PH65_9CHLO|nr:hypothetical protein Rsub_11915 [Raphidocelis subcapitata]|eukprot:GBF99106.1 hypothetical protein Rsub_11915 [Raphidocelis subcapitata]